MNTGWHVVPSLEDWLQYALDVIAKAEAEALRVRGVFHLVLAGGSTPRLLYAALAREAHDWSRWQIWLGDERCLPPDDPERNSHMVRASLLATPESATANLHEIPAQLGAFNAAAHYSTELANVDHFDLVLLGLGEDGHTASLFPGQDWGETPTAADAIPVFNAPKPPAERVSLSAARLSRTRHVLFLVTGSGKRDAISRWRHGEPLPAAAVHPQGGCDVLMLTESFPDGDTP